MLKEECVPGKLVKVSPELYKNFNAYIDILGECIEPPDVMWDTSPYVCVWWPKLNIFNFWMPRSLIPWNNK